MSSRQRPQWPVERHGSGDWKRKLSGLGALPSTVNLVGNPSRRLAPPIIIADSKPLDGRTTRGKHLDLLLERHP